RGRTRGFRTQRTRFVKPGFPRPRVSGAGPRTRARKGAIVSLNLSLRAAPTRLTFPCSQSQKRFWFESQVHPDNPGLNVAVRWRLEGDVVHAHLEQAWETIVARHQTLRTAFTTID